MTRILFILLISCNLYADNAALGYWISAADFQGIPDKWDYDDLQATLHQGKELSYKQNRWLDGCSFTIKEVLRSSKCKECQFIPKASYQDGFSLLLPHLARMLPLNKTLVLHARRLEVRKDYSKATEAYLASLRFAKHIGQDPVVISSLVSYTMLDDTLSGIERLGFRADFPKNLRQKLHDEVAQTIPTIRKAMHRAYLSEKLLFEPIVHEVNNKKFDKLIMILNTYVDEGLRQELSLYPDPVKENLSQQQQREVAKLLGVPEATLKTPANFLQYLADGVYEFQQQTEKIAKIFAMDYQQGCRQYKKSIRYVREGHFFIRQFAALEVYKKHTQMMISLNRMQVALALCGDYQEKEKFVSNLEGMIADSFLHKDNFQYQQTEDGGVMISIYDALALQNYICKVRKNPETGKWKWIFMEKKL